MNFFTITADISFPILRTVRTFRQRLLLFEDPVQTRMLMASIRSFGPPARPSPYFSNVDPLIHHVCMRLTGRWGHKFDSYTLFAWAEKVAFLVRHRYGPDVLQYFSAISLLELSEPRNRRTEYKILLLAMDTTGEYDVIIEYKCSRSYALPYGFMDMVDAKVDAILNGQHRRSPIIHNLTEYKYEDE